MEIGPIWRALQRQRTSYVLIALQIAVTMALMVNAIAIIQERMRLMGRDSGIDEDNIFYVNSNSFDPDQDFQAMVAADLEMIRNTAGVVSAILTNSVPLQGGGWGQRVQTEPGAEVDAVGAALYFSDEYGLDTFGVKLIAGRNFTPTEVGWFDPGSDVKWPPHIIITAELARSLFPDADPEEAAGKVVYLEEASPATVVGVIERMQAAWKSWENVEHAMLVPQMRGDDRARYVVRASPGYRDQLIPEIEAALAQRDRNRVVLDTRTMTDVRRLAYLGDSAMIKLLVFIIGLLTGITCLGIVGLASFSVARRTRQIGTRRALGASRSAILRYFLLENFLISSVGVTGGAILAIGLNLWMVQSFNLTPIGWYMIPAAMLVLWLLGQLAVLGPARRASRVSPAVATRAV